jgi:hypothetical protein
MKTASELSKERRERLKSQGLCINCGKNESLSNKTKCEICLIAARKSSKKYISENPNAKEVRNRWKTNETSREKHRESRKKWRLKYKYKVIEFLGGKCECCAETTIEFLQIDHVNRDGWKHRKEVGKSLRYLRDIVKNPTKYSLRILCANCHFALTNFDSCPHKKVENENGLAQI